MRVPVTESGADLKVAQVEGDNVFARLADLQEAGNSLENLDTGQPLSSWGYDPTAANAYLT